jgi:hypothetical protein
MVESRVFLITVEDIMFCDDALAINPSEVITCVLVALITVSESIVWLFPAVCISLWD